MIMLKNTGFKGFHPCDYEFCVPFNPRPVVRAQCENTEDATIYRSLAKKGPFMKERPPATFGPISCIGSKFI